MVNDHEKQKALVNSLRQEISSDPEILTKLFFDQSPLITVAIMQNYGLLVIEEIIKQGADVNALDYQGRAPIFYAIALILIFQKK